MAEKRFSDSPTGSASMAVAVVPHDTNEVVSNGTYSRALYIGGAGTVIVHMADDDADTNISFLAVQAGQILDIQAKRVKATGTTATGIVALF